MYLKSFKPSGEIDVCIGVGISLLSHAIQELAAMGLKDPIDALGIENQESVFSTSLASLLIKSCVANDIRMSS